MHSCHNDGYRIHQYSEGRFSGVAAVDAGAPWIDRVKDWSLRAREVEMPKW